MRKAIVFGVFLALAAGACSSIIYQNYKVDASHIKLMESKDDFTDDEINMLYHWRNPGRYGDHAPSDRFCELYDKKIKPL